MAALAEPLLRVGAERDANALGEDAELGVGSADTTLRDGPPGASPRSSLVGALSNVLLAVLGAGQLTLPWVMSRLGLAFGLALLFVFALVAAYSSELLRALTLVTGAGTYGEVLARVIGPRWERACDAVVVLYAWGTAVGYLLIVKEQLHRVAAFFDGGDGPLPWEENKSALLVVVAALVVFPLSVLRDLSALKYTSALGAVAAAYIVTIVSFYAPWDRPGSGDDASRHAVVFGIRACAATSSNGAASLALWPASATSALTAVPMLSFALNSGWAFVPIVSQLENPTPARGRALIYLAHAVFLIMYVIISITGYLSYCGDVEDNVMDSLPTDAAPALAARIALIAQLLCGIPLRFHVIASAVLATGPEEVEETGTSFEEGDGEDDVGVDEAHGEVAPATAICEDASGSYTAAAHDSRRRGSGFLNLFGSARWIAAQTVLVPLAALNACAATRLHVVVGLTSAVCASCIVYVFPGVAFLAADRGRAGYEQERRRREGCTPALRRIVAMALIKLGTFIMVTGTIANAADARPGGKGGAR